MSISAKNSRQEFDQSVCFTCFSSWVETVRLMAQDSPETALRAFLTLADYCLYGAEPDPTENAWGAVWPLVKGEAKRSIANRRRGFGAEDVALSDTIRAYAAGHPGASQRAIADALGCSLGKVNKTLQRASGAVGTGFDIVDGAVDGTVIDNVNVSREHGGNGNGLSLHPVEQTECEVFGFPLCEEVEA